jgi:hypothetical protein
MATPVASLWCVFVRQVWSGAVIVPFGGGVLGVAPWASLVATIGGIALCFIVFLGELLCLPTIRRPPIQGDGQGVHSEGKVDGVLSLLPGWCR